MLETWPTNLIAWLVAFGELYRIIKKTKIYNRANIIFYMFLFTKRGREIYVENFTWKSKTFQIVWVPKLSGLYFRSSLNRASFELTLANVLTIFGTQVMFNIHIYVSMSSISKEFELALFLDILSVKIIAI